MQIRLLLMSQKSYYKHFDSNYLFVPLSILLLYVLQDGYVNEDKFETWWELLVKFATFTWPWLLYSTHWKCSDCRIFSFQPVSDHLYFFLISSLIGQLQKLQSIIAAKVPRTVTARSTQTSTCLMVSGRYHISLLLHHYLKLILILVLVKCFLFCIWSSVP